MFRVLGVEGLSQVHGVAILILAYITALYH